MGNTESIPNKNKTKTVVHSGTSQHFNLNEVIIHPRYPQITHYVNNTYSPYLHNITLSPHNHNILPKVQIQIQQTTTHK